MKLQPNYNKKLIFDVGSLKEQSTLIERKANGISTYLFRFTNPIFDYFDLLHIICDQKDDPHTVVLVRSSKDDKYDRIAEIVESVNYETGETEFWGDQQEFKGDKWKGRRYYNLDKSSLFMEINPVSGLSITIVNYLNFCKHIVYFN